MNKPKKSRKPTANKSGWGNAREVYCDRNNHEPAPMNERTVISHPITGKRMAGLAFQKEVAQAVEEHGCWPLPEMLEPTQLAEETLYIGVAAVRLVQARTHNGHIPAEQFQQDRHTVFAS